MSEELRFPFPIDFAAEKAKREQQDVLFRAHVARMERHQKMRPFGTTFWVVGRWVCPREQWLRDKKEVALQWGTNE